MRWHKACIVHSQDESSFFFFFNLKQGETTFFLSSLGKRDLDPWYIVRYGRPWKTVKYSFYNRGFDLQTTCECRPCANHINMCVLISIYTFYIYFLSIANVDFRPHHWAPCHLRGPRMIFSPIPTYGAIFFLNNLTHDSWNWFFVIITYYVYNRCT